MILTRADGSILSMPARTSSRDDEASPPAAGALERGAQEQLLRQILEGGPEARRLALGRFLDDCRGPALCAVHRTLAACGADRRLAEEALQEATLKLLAGGLQAFRAEAAPRTYFVRIAINAALDAVRRQLRRRELGALEQQPVMAATAEEQLAAVELREALRRCLDELPHRHRESVGLYYLEEVGDCAACARAAGVSRDAFMQQISRARQRLADCLRRRLR
jgi:RNA polymerase sigma factor (sigma-70 family)